VNIVPVSCRFSIIIPVIHESEIINTLLESLKHIETDEPFEIIVVDGSSTRDTLSAIMDKTVITQGCEQGRGRQMNAGAALAHGEILIFLHVDTFLPTNALSVIKETLENKQLVGGAFTLQIQSQKRILRIIAADSTLRSQITRAPYGDQVIFLRKSCFDAIGGYADIPIMEDVELMRRIKKTGGHIAILSHRVVTSARRWDQEGLLYVLLRDTLIIFLFWCGVSAEKLAKYYPLQQNSTS
jgi:rSAM/selenodomain-associated transferase 2